ncbi:PrgI family protein [bacterium]|nr:PrgI family protein [bacterium]
MKQHPIPQNVLDVEFKLFTRFTLKEFAYLAAGVVSGSLFLVLNKQLGLPALLAWPSFLILSSIGAFFALVPINDQGADEFIKNFFTAINKPTQRVWLNEQMQSQRVKPIVKTDDGNKGKIVGGKITKGKKIFIEKPGDDILKVQTPKISTKPEPTMQQSKPLQQTVVIGPQNISKYQFGIKSVDRLPGNINIWLTDTNNRGLANIPVYLKDKNGKVIFANRTGQNGYFILNRILPQGIYYIQFDQNTYIIPNIQWILENTQSKNPIKITAKLT